MTARDAFSDDPAADLSTQALFGMSSRATGRAGAEGAPIVLDGKYRLEERLGEGASGVVYRAFHLHLKKTLAVKLLHPGSLDPASLARFHREAEVLGRLRHPHVVEVTDFGIDGSGIPYLVMELLEGRTLASFCEEEGALPLARALPLLDGIAAAVDAAHAQGVLHRDLKPGNVLLVASDDGAGPRVKVLDFGLAEIIEPYREAREDRTGGASESLDAAIEEDFRADRLTETGALAGTPRYVAPELIRQGSAGRASDLYSFGVIAYELFAGEPPFRGSPAEVLVGHVSREAPAPAPAGVPLSDEVWQALRQPLRKDPALRPASAREIVAKIRRAAERTSLAEWRTTELPRRSALAVGLSGLLLLAGLLLPWPLVPRIDDWIQDYRAGSAPVRAPDPRILLLTVDEASLADGAPPFANRADEIGATLDRVFSAGARGIAIDLLLPAKWGDSPAFSELVLRHSEGIVLAAFSRPDGRVVGPECVAGLTAAALGPDRVSALFGFVNLEEDEDGVTRKGRLRHRDRSGRTRPSWAAKAAALLKIRNPAGNESAAFRLDSRIDWPRYSRISWREVSATLDRAPGWFRNRLVLVGGDFEGSGDDIHRVSHPAKRAAIVSGLTLQAMIVDSLVAGRTVREPARVPFLFAAIPPLGLALAGLLIARRAGPAGIPLAAAAALYLAASFPAFWWAGLQLPVSPLLLVSFGLLLVLLIRRWLPPAPEVSS